ncbi:hypothetical protein CHUAL_010135 [Chamberlinius hualienensis]
MVPIGSYLPSVVGGGAAALSVDSHLIKNHLSGATNANHKLGVNSLNSLQPVQPAANAAAAAAAAVLAADPVNWITWPQPPYMVTLHSNFLSITVILIIKVINIGLHD